MSCFTNRKNVGPQGPRWRPSGNPPK